MPRGRDYPRRVDDEVVVGNRMVDTEVGADGVAHLPGRKHILPLCRCGDRTSDMVVGALTEQGAQCGWTAGAARP